jgi:glutamate--cysteine ligase
VVELFPVDAATRRICPVVDDGGDGPSTLRFLRRFAAPRRWDERRSAKGVPVFHLPNGGTLTFEPGGQIELGAPPRRSASALLELLRDVILPLRREAADQGIDMLAVGLDPDNAPDDVPLQLHAPRYERMAEYFAALEPGGSGARMMRQTAAVQVSLDLGDPDVAPFRWRVLNAVAPSVVAIFANSPVYAGRPTGHRSWRAAAWRALDPSRTGTPVPARGADPVPAYLRFALDAGAMMHRDADGRWPAFGELVERGLATPEGWDEHLTTLFPEVRPRGYLEVRSADAVAPEWYAAPLALLSGIAYDARALSEADALLPHPGPALLERAGRLGLRDPEIAATAGDLFAIALEGCVRLGADWLSARDLECAREFFARYTSRGRSPADDTDAPAPAPARPDPAPYSGWTSPTYKESISSL